MTENKSNLISTVIRLNQGHKTPGGRGRGGAEGGRWLGGKVLGLRGGGVNDIHLDNQLTSEMLESKHADIDGCM